MQRRDLILQIKDKDILYFPEKKERGSGCKISLWQPFAYQRGAILTAAYF